VNFPLQRAVGLQVASKVVLVVSASSLVVEVYVVQHGVPQGPFGGRAAQEIVPDVVGDRLGFLLGHQAESAAVGVGITMTDEVQLRILVAVELVEEDYEDVLVVVGGIGFSYLMARKQHIAIFTTASLPWMTRTAVNPLFRAAYLAKNHEREVTLVIPWLTLKDQTLVYPNKITFSSLEEHEAYVYCWLKEKADILSEFRIAFYPGKLRHIEAIFSKEKRRILPVGDTTEMIPVGDTSSHILLGSQCHTKGVLQAGNLLIQSSDFSALLQLSGTVLHVGTVVRLSAATQDLPRSIICNVPWRQPQIPRGWENKASAKTRSSDSLFQRCKVFVNPSTTDVVCTTTAVALAMGKIVICANHPSNEFFKQFPNCHMYNSSHKCGLGLSFCEFLQGAGIDDSAADSLSLPGPAARSRSFCPRQPFALRVLLASWVRRRITNTASVPFHPSFRACAVPCLPLPITHRFRLRSNRAMARGIAPTLFTARRARGQRTRLRRFFLLIPVPAAEYEEALDCLSSLITRRTRADGSNKGDHFDLMFDYLKILELEDAIPELKVIHVAGTKGKGSTCTFTESILRCCGFRTGLFTSPHLIDVRERFRLDGVEVSEEKFLEYFWWCWHRLQEKTGDDVPMPTYFRFLALLAFKIFSAEQVDVAIMEVGLGGKFDATNVVQKPIVCGISSLGYDHMEILGHTLREIAGEKAGIFKKGVPAYTVPQPEEAMHALEDKASQLGVPLQLASPLDTGLLKNQHLGLDGEHQYLNAGLAIALSSVWLETTGNLKNMNIDEQSLPEQFVSGLSRARLEGRAQIVPDSLGQVGGLTFYLDGAHSPESMEMCAKWYSHVIREDPSRLGERPHENHYMRQGGHPNSLGGKDHQQILLFNCMSVRDPQLLLPRLINTCDQHGVKFYKAIFVPNQSVYNKVTSLASPPTDPQRVDLSWQLTLQKVWENFMHSEQGPSCASVCEDSLVFPSLPLAIKWLRESVQQSRSVQVQVLVTGSLHLVGDVLKLIKN
ncbi:hypothetical protein MUK42_05805, partial [Musa troglodytarum]